MCDPGIIADCNFAMWKKRYGFCKTVAQNKRIGDLAPNALFVYVVLIYYDFVKDNS